MPDQKPSRLPILVVYLIFLGLFLVLLSTNSSPPARSVSYSAFLDEVRGGNVLEVEITETELRAVLFGGTEAEPQPNVDDSYLLGELEAHQVDVRGRSEVSAFDTILFIWLLPLIVIMIIYGFAMRRMRGGVGGPMTFGKSRAKIHDQYTTSDVTFKDVAGVDEAEAELVEVVDFLKNPQKYTRLGGRIPKGVLLVGAPGTGKTLLARAVSGEAEVPFFSISGSEFMEMFVGVGAARVRDLFEQAKNRAPCIIFIDELDAVGKTRSSGRGVFLGHDEREQTLNQLLAEMDGFDTTSGVIIMAATNTPEVLDPALLRAGRFDRQVVVDRPDLEGRLAIIQIHVANVKLAEAVDLQAIASRTPGMVGADLANIVNEAALLAARRQAELVEMRDLEEAIDRVMLGLEKKSRLMSAPEKERVAFHETGHAVTALSVRHADPVHRISIIPRSIGALGHTLQLPTAEKYLMTRPELEDQITVMLGGRVAEEVSFGGVVSTGAANDLDRASELARQMVTRFGMSDTMGHMTYGSPGTRFLPSPFGSESRNYSERTAERIDAEAERIIDECYKRATTILLERRRDLSRIARELIVRETLDRTRIDEILTGTSDVVTLPA